MRERLVSLCQVLFMLAICLTILTGVKLYRGNDSTPVQEDPIEEDTIPGFYTLSPDEGLREALEYYGLHHPDIVYAQAILETGNFRSNVCINRNNLFGLYNSRKREYYKFDHWAESIEAYRDWIQRKYNPPQDYYKFLERINYASDPLYTNKLKTIVKNGKRRHTEGDSIP